MSDMAVETPVDDPQAGADPAASDEAPGAVQSDVTPDGGDAVQEQAAPSWAPSREEWEAVTQTVAQLQPTLAQLQQAVTPPPAPEPSLGDYFQQEPDGSYAIDPQNLERYINDRIEQGVNGRLAPITPVIDQTIQERGERLIQDEFGKLQATVGKFDTALARPLAEGLVREVGDPNQAILKAAQIAHEAYKQAKAEGVEEYKQTLANVGNAHAEPGASGAAILSEPKPSDYSGAIDNWLARNGARSDW